MKRLIFAFLITIVIGFIIYYISSTLFLKQDRVKNSDTPKKEEIKYSFDISYGTQIELLDIDDKLQDAYVIILIGEKEHNSTKKVSTLLGKSINNKDFKAYYIEKDDNFNYQKLISKNAEIANYLNFTPVILAFKSGNFVAGLPGEVEEKNISAFLEYVLALN